MSQKVVRMHGSGKDGRMKLLITVACIAVVAFVLKKLGVVQYLSLENTAKLKDWIAGYGALGPVIYIALFVTACIFFLPGLPIGVLGGVAFGPVKGALFASIGATLGATAAFLIARYAARSMVESWVEKNPQLKKLDEGVRQQGWRMLMITRLVPIFPFNLQNYAYGLTDIPLLTYIVVSFLCMLPGTIAYTFAGGTLTSGGDIKKILTYLGIAAVFFVMLSLIPGWIRKKHGGNLGI
ncbi:TVP38/TMEM64 family protein [Thermosediminibacter oceani]|uniref:TVP38/TMEM64 family membrane protein n=1 Tax=Thermosediminibacter oceani (strain ATCC BAA-1034 / DSM 16646 / JW/IW-1228P) TaxID=555079 RepID=D9RZI2_THEOJ|nr:TVP38/TMEM64 family protein [Thermosediminibacter oceani]ADL06880.1 SNARE associated Golgi protein-related protein [Thermosediminibacter oceani DSM 16646]